MARIGSLGYAKSKCCLAPNGLRHSRLILGNGTVWPMPPYARPASRAGGEPNHMVIRRVLDDRALQVVQPGTNGQPQYQKPILPDVDMGGFRSR